MGARIYIPTLGRFTSVDPVEGGSANRYVFAQEPVNTTDINGRILETISDVVSVGISIYFLAKDPSLGNLGGLALDVGGAAVPFVPSGAGYAKAIGKGADKAGDASKASRQSKYINDSYLKKQGIDAHALKREYLGKYAQISRYDLYKDSKSGEILIQPKGGGNSISTGRYID